MVMSSRLDGRTVESWPAHRRKARARKAMKAKVRRYGDRTGKIEEKRMGI